MKKRPVLKQIRGSEDRWVLLGDMYTMLRDNGFADDIDELKAELIEEFKSGRIETRGIPNYNEAGMLLGWVHIHVNVRDCIKWLEKE